MRALTVHLSDVSITHVADPADLLRRPAATAPDAGTGPASAAITDRASRWWYWYVAVLLVLDATAFLLGGVVGQLVRFQNLDSGFHGVAYGDLVLASVPLWLLVLCGARTYERRFLGLGSDEFRRVVNAAAHFTALVAIIVFATRFTVARGLVVAALPTATALTLVFRYSARQVLHRLRSRGVACHRVLVVGEGPARDVLVRRLADAPYSGLHVVGTCAPPSAADPAEGLDLLDRVRADGADVVAVAHSPEMDAHRLRRLAWSLEGTGVDLLVAPALTDVAGPRIHVRPVSGIPLLQIGEPDFSGVKRFVKSVVDRLAAAVALVLASPLFLVIAVAVRLSGPGPVLFRQERVGRDGRSFTIYKFRSMDDQAEKRLAQLHHLNDHGRDGVMFKMRDDPRVTPVGRWLRRYSLDELPQLLNVVRGEMSLVGPRPPLPHEVARYGDDAFRRLLVKPGLTGLWQVSGRSDLDWDETVRLDLYYVENWSVALDAEIIWKTVFAVLRADGAR